MLPQTLYQTAIKFATLKHVAINQKVPGTDLPYVVHLSNVAMEVMMANANTENFNVALAIQAALLHDTIEDTTLKKQILRLIHLLKHYLPMKHYF